MGKDTGKAGLVLLIFGIIGLIVVFSVPWLSNGEDVEYSDLDYEEYFEDSANLSLYGFIVLILAGVVLSIQAVTGKIYDMLSPALPSALRSNPRHPEFLKVFLTLVVIVFTLMIIVSGTRFVGFARVAEDAGEDDASTPAGWAVFIIGLILLALEIMYLKTCQFLQAGDDPNRYRQRLHNYVSLMTFLCLLGLMFFSLLPMMATEDEEDDLNWNDGLIHLYSKYEGGGSLDDMDDDMGWMRLFLWGGFIVGIISLLGLAYHFYSGDDRSQGFHFFASLGGIIAILGILFLIVHISFFFHIADFEEQWSDGGEFDVDCSFSYNYIPLLCSIGMIGLGALYIKEAYPVSIKSILGTKSAGEEGTAPVAMKMDDPYAETGEAEYAPASESPEAPAGDSDWEAPAKEEKQTPGVSVAPVAEPVPAAPVEFPIVDACPGCRQRIRAYRPGRICCPACEAISVVDNSGEFRIEESE